MNGTRQRTGKRNATSNSTSTSSSTQKPPPQKRNKTYKSQARSKSPEDDTEEPKYRVRTSPPIDSSEDLLLITESTGDIFAAPPNTLLIHSCNCAGSWGAGIAAAFKSRFPQAFEVHKAHCDEFGAELVGTAQLIGPVDFREHAATEGDGEETSASTTKDEKPAKHFVGCLFTSAHYGRRKDSPKQILSATAPAMVDLLRKVNDWNAEAAEEDKVREVRMCKINSGLFKVPWAKTKGVLTEIDVARSQVKEVKVVELPPKE